MTNRERFLDLLPDYKYYAGEKNVLKTLTPEIFVEWLTQENFHLSDAFYYFMIFGGFWEQNMNDVRALVKWIEEDCNVGRR